MLVVRTWPQTQDPVLVVALSGWVDSGAAGAGAAGLLRRAAHADTFATYDLDAIGDLSTTRPHVRVQAGSLRVVSTPHLDLAAGTLGRDVVTLLGPEPAQQWSRFTRELASLAQRLGVREAYFLGGMPAPVSHRQPLRVLTTVMDEAASARYGPVRPDYEGPTGAQTVLQAALGEAGVRAIGLWAQVAPYLTGAPCPPAQHAVLEHLCTLAGLDFDLDQFASTTEAYLAHVERLVASRPDVEELARRLESGPLATPADAIPSGDDLAAEIERFLEEGGT